MSIRFTFGGDEHIFGEVSEDMSLESFFTSLSMTNAVREAQIYTARTFNYSSLVVAAILFLLATIPLARLTDHLQRRDRQRRLQGAL